MSDADFAIDQEEMRKDPPSDLEAERNLLGALLLDGTLLARIGDEVRVLEPEDFSSKKHQAIFGAILQRSATSDDFNPVIINDLLENQGKLADAGGRDYVLNLSAITSPHSSVAEYAKIIKDKSRRRRMIWVAEQIVRMGYVPEGRSVDEIYDQAQGLIFDLAQNYANQESGPKPILPVALDIIDKIESKTILESANGVLTGFVELDNLTHGLQPGSLNIVAARPGMGKTSFAMNIITNIALNQEVTKPALVFSLEMPIDQLVMRMLSSFGRVSISDILDFKVGADEWHSMIQKISLLHLDVDGKEYNKIFIDDSGDIDPLQLRSRARQLASEFGGLSVIMVDYIQLMRTTAKYTSRALEVGEISRSLKLLAKELNIPVIALSQLNREVEGRKDHRPINSDLRESGSLEQDADTVLFLHREYLYSKLDEDISKALLIVSKNRNGATRDIQLQFQGEYTTFYDMDDSSSSLYDDIPLDSPYQ